MAIVARYQRHLSPPTSPSPCRPSQTPDLTDLLQPSNAHLRTPLPRTDSETRREELTKQLARDETPVSMGAPGGEGASNLLARAVVGRYVESYLPGVRRHQVALERGVGVVGESLRQRRQRESGAASGGDASDTTLSSLVRGIEVEWLMLSKIAPPTVALYVWWVVFAVWRELEGGGQDFVAQFMANQDRVEIWLKWASVGLVALLCILVLIVWAIVGAIRVFSGSKLDPRQKDVKYM